MYYFEYNDDIVFSIADAGRNLGRLEKIISGLTYPDYFANLVLKKDASRAFGQSRQNFGVIDYIRAKAGISDGFSYNLSEVDSYVSAVNYGFKQLKELPLSLRLIREINYVLTGQNYFFPDSSLHKLDSLERFMHEKSGIYPLVKAALLHEAFENIKPFEGKNSVLARIFGILYLADKGFLKYPVIALSEYINLDNPEYISSVSCAHKTGNYSPWIKFFADSLNASVLDSIKVAEKLNQWHLQDIKKIRELGCTENNAKIILESMFEKPTINIEETTRKLEVSVATSGRLLEKLCDEGILINLDNRRRNKIFIYTRMLEFFN